MAVEHVVRVVDVFLPLVADVFFHQGGFPGIGFYAAIELDYGFEAGCQEEHGQKESNMPCGFLPYLRVYYSQHKEHHYATFE